MTVNMHPSQIVMVALIATFIRINVSIRGWIALVKYTILYIKKVTLLQSMVSNIKHRSVQVVAMVAISTKTRVLITALYMIKLVVMV